MALYRKFDPATLSKAGGTPANLANPANLQPRLAALATLAGSPLPNTDPERSAIVEIDGNVPREWAEAFTALQSAPCPEWMAPERWRALIDTAGMFVARWARAAAALGWDASSFLGLSGGLGDQSYDPAGAVIESLMGLKVCAVTKDGIAVQFPDGGRRLISKRGKAWEWD